MLAPRCRPWRSLARLLPVLALTGCGVRAGEVRQTYADQGKACVDEDDGGLTLDFGGCLSGQCEELANGVCDAQLDGERLVVTGSVQVVTTGDRACKDTCGSAQVSCEVPAGVTDATVVAYAGEETAWADLEVCDWFQW
jgi:hypothetical protein